MTTWDQLPGVYDPFESTDVLLPGPHNQFIRNGILLNDRTQLECFWVDDFTGFGYPTMKIAEDDNVEETGSLPGPGDHGPRTMTMTGWIQAGNYPRMLRMGRALLDSLIDLVEMPMQIVTMNPTGIFLQPEVEIFCRPTDEPQLATQIQPGDIAGTIKRNFTISLRATDPTYTSLVEKHATLQPEVVSVFGRPYDRVYDLTYSELLDTTGSVVAGGGDNVVVVNNAGNYRAPIRIRATGDMTAITVVNETTGQVMYFANITTGQWIEVDTHPRRGTVRDQNNIMRRSTIDPRSDWITLQGKRGGTTGDNNIVLYVEGYGAGSQLDVWWKDTSL